MAAAETAPTPGRLPERRERGSGEVVLAVGEVRGGGLPVRQQLPVHLDPAKVRPLTVGDPRGALRTGRHYPGAVPGCGPGDVGGRGTVLGVEEARRPALRQRPPGARACTQASANRPAVN